MGVTPVAQNNNEAQSSDTKYTPRPIADPLDPIETGSRALFVLKEKIDRMLLVAINKKEFYNIPEEEKEKNGRS